MFNPLFLNSILVNLFQICLSDADVSSAEEANMILQTHSNPHQVEEFILEGMHIL